MKINEIVNMTEKNPHRDMHNALSSEENRDINNQRQNELNKRAALVKKFAQIEKGRHAKAIEDPIKYKMDGDNSATMPYKNYKSKAANYAANVKPEYYFEKAPPGREDQVKALKKKWPNNLERVYATAWASYNKSK